MSSSVITGLIEDAELAFTRPAGSVEPGLEVDEPSLLQLRKACRLLASAEEFIEVEYYTMVVEASFAAIERSIEYRLLALGRTDPGDLPGTHAGVYREAARIGLLSADDADAMADLWRNNRAKTYYQDGKATRERADVMLALGRELHAFVVGHASIEHECQC